MWNLSDYWGDLENQSRDMWNMSYCSDAGLCFSTTLPLLCIVSYWAVVELMVKSTFYCTWILLLMSVFFRKLAGDWLIEREDLVILRFPCNYVFWYHHNPLLVSIVLYFLINVLACYLNLHLCFISDASFEVGYLKSKAVSYTLCTSCSALSSLVHGKYSCWSVHSGHVWFT